LNGESKNSDFLSNAGILAIIAAAFSLSAGIVGLVSYQSYIAYYSYYSVDVSDSAVGFLLFAGFAFVSAAFGFVGGAFSLMRKRFKFTILGTALMCASAVFTLIIEWRYEFGYSDGVLVSVVPTLALALASFILLVKSKKAFADYTKTVKIPEAETSKTPIIDEKIDEAFKD
jgi:hypothetical protein